MKNRSLAYSYLEEAAPVDLHQDMKELHTTLPMTELITLFENEISEVIEYDSFEYEHSQKALHVFKGSPKLHKCRYRIITRNQALGVITLTRKKPFSEGEMITVEKALGALSIHLNNAFEFQASLGDEQLTELKVDSRLSTFE